MADITHRHVELLRAIVQAGSLTAAAQALHTSQPTLSRELARLEALIGYALFERTGRRLRPTLRAFALMDDVHRAHAALGAVRERAAALRLAAPAALAVATLPALAHALLPRVCARLLRREPALQVGVAALDSSALEVGLGQQQYDLGIGERAARQPGVKSELLAQLHEVAVLPAGHPLLARRRLALGDFEGQPFIALAPDDPYRQAQDARFAAAGVTRRMALYTGSAVGVCAMVAEGLGVAIVNPLTAAACAGPRLQVRPLVAAIPFELHLLWPTERPAHPHRDAFIAALRATLAAASGPAGTARPAP